jgi:hypothetical protein
MRPLIVSALTAFAVAFLAGCPSTPVATHDCQDIISACHEVDPGAGPLHDCHEIGHDEVESACTPERDRCVALCEAAASVDAGVTADAPHVHDEDAPHSH